MSLEVTNADEWEEVLQKGQNNDSFLGCTIAKCDWKGRFNEINATFLNYIYWLGSVSFHGNYTSN